MGSWNGAGTEISVAKGFCNFNFAISKFGCESVANWFRNRISNFLYWQPKLKGLAPT